MSKRRDAKTMARWEDQARQWATATARDLAVNLYYNRETAARPYSVGVVLDPGEKVWAEVPIRFNFDLTATVSGCHDVLPAFRPWLVTSDRVVGRLASDRLQGYRWENVCGIRVDLAPGHEVIGLDIDGEPALTWDGPAVAPMAVAAVFQLFGPRGVIEHPGLTSLRAWEDGWISSPN